MAVMEIGLQAGAYQQPPLALDQFFFRRFAAVPATEGVQQEVPDGQVGFEIAAESFDPFGQAGSPGNPLEIALNGIERFHEGNLGEGPDFLLLDLGVENDIEVVKGLGDTRVAAGGFQDAAGGGDNLACPPGEEGDERVGFPAAPPP